MPYLKMERRKKRRIEAALTLDILYGTNKLTTQSKNISMLGTLIENEQQIPVGTNVEITIYLPLYGHYRKPVGPVKCQGTIFRSTLATQAPNPPLFRLGIFFSSFSSKQDSDMLSAYMDYFVSKEKTFVKKRLKQLKAKLKREKEALKKAQKKSKDKFKKSR
jgi:hypothetical protein